MAHPQDKVLVWLKGEVKTPPFSNQARLEAGLLLRRLQQGQGLSLPTSRPDARDRSPVPRVTNQRS